MTYINPYHLIGIDPEKQPRPDAATLKRAKRKLLSRFELEDSITIPYATGQIDRAQVLAALDEFEDPEKLELHRQLWQHKGYRKFLLNGEVQVLTNLRRPEQLVSQKFALFLEKYMVDAWRGCLQKSLEKERFRDVVVLVFRKDLLWGDSWEKAFAPLAHYYEQACRELPLLKIGSPDYRRWIRRLGNKLLMRALNNLPGSMHPLKNKYAQLLAAFSRQLLSKGEDYWPDAAILCDAGLRLYPEPEIRENLWNIQLRIRDRIFKGWGEYVDEARLANMKKLSSAENQKIDWKKVWPRFAVFGGFSMVALTLIFLMFRDSGSGWDPGPVNGKDERSFSNFYAWKEFRKMQEAAEAKMAPPKIFTLLSDYTAYTQSAPPVAMADSLRPENGSRPYETLHPNLMIPTQLTVPVQLTNQGDKDVVFFLINTDEGREPERHYYVRAGKSWICDSMPLGNFIFSVYEGTNWNPGAINPDPKIKKRRDQHRIGAFESDQNTIVWHPAEVPPENGAVIAPAEPGVPGHRVLWDGKAISVREHALPRAEAGKMLSQQQKEWQDHLAGKSDSLSHTSDSPDDLPVR